MSKTTQASKRRPAIDNVNVSPKVAEQLSQPDRKGDRLLQLPQMSEVTTLTEATLRWLRHRGEGPPMFRLGRRLVCWEGDLHGWIEEQAAKDAAAS